MSWFSSKQTHEITVSVTGMSCDGCVRSLTKKLLATPGVLEAEVTLKPHGRARVRGSASEEDLKKAIAEAGYTAS